MPASNAVVTDTIEIGEVTAYCMQVNGSTVLVSEDGKVGVVRLNHKEIELSRQQPSGGQKGVKVDQWLGIEELKLNRAQFTLHQLYAAQDALKAFMAGAT